MKPLPLEIRTLSDRLVEVLRDFILSGAIESELPIRQDALASELRVSKIPLREALARLEQDGLVVSQPNRGFFVRPMSPEEAEEIYALRLKLEPDAAAVASLKATEADHERARLALAHFDAEAVAQKPTVGASKPSTTRCSTRGLTGAKRACASSSRSTSSTRSATCAARCARIRRRVRR